MTKFKKKQILQADYINFMLYMYTGKHIFFNKFEHFRVLIEFLLIYKYKTLK